jgi:hypothetical protein
MQSRTTVFLKVNYGDFNTIDKQIAAHKIAAVHDEIGEIYGSEDDVIPCNDDVIILHALSYRMTPHIMVPTP